MQINQEYNLSVRLFGVLSTKVGNKIYIKKIFKYAFTQ